MQTSTGIAGLPLTPALSPEGCRTRAEPSPGGGDEAPAVQSAPPRTDAEVTSPLRGEVDAQRRVRGSVSRARSLRRNETDAEHKFWQMVRGRQIGGWKFARQVAIGPYFADFVCREAALIVELDGSQHVDSSTDQARTDYLTAQGYSVLRFWNSDVLGNPHGVADSLLAAIAGHPSPGERFAPATLSPEGRGERGSMAATTKQRSYRLTADIPRLLKD
ncbi:DUF559 domain-containing protein [Devosia sp. A16]|uniref:endonuclease domain-containing protein n=1 Tax=Devosia sp. A16 TaxID=1736675 RepID=UPI0009E73922